MNHRGMLRRVAAVWLMVQLAWLTALIPRDCCAAHRPDRHETGSHSSMAAGQCPMRSADGTPCPMHRAAPSHATHGHAHDAATGSDPSSEAPATCFLRGSCAGPMAALLVLLGNHGVLPESTTTPPDVAVRSIVLTVDERAAGHAVPPDPPPPRA